MNKKVFFRLVVIALLALVVIGAQAPEEPTGILWEFFAAVFDLFPIVAVGSAALVLTTIVEILKQLGAIPDGQGGIVFGGLNAALWIILFFAAKLGATATVDTIIDVLAAILPVLAPIFVSVVTGWGSWKLLRLADVPLFRK